MAGSTNFPAIAEFADMLIIATITGTETMPLITADKNNARIGFMPAKLSAMPPSVAPARIK